MSQTAKGKRTGRGADGPTEARVEQVALKLLVPHPDQAAYFATADAKTYRDLVASIKKEGVNVPLDVLPGGNAAELPAYTIIAGHTRARAAVEAGLTTVPARVRHDLIHAARGRVDELFLGDNALRRQMTPLARARVAVGIYRAREAAAGREVSGSVFLYNAKLRVEVSTILSMSGRNLNRYLNVLEAPTEVQQAVEAGTVKLVDAARVTGLAWSDRQKLAGRLRAGEDAAAVFADIFPARPGGRHVKPKDAVDAFAKQLVKACDDLADRLADVRPATVRRLEAVLLAGIGLVDGLLARRDAG